MSALYIDWQGTRVIAPLAYNDTSGRNSEIRTPIFTEEGERARANGATIDQLVVGVHLKIISVEDAAYHDRTRLPTWRESNAASYTAHMENRKLPKNKRAK